MEAAQVASEAAEPNAGAAEAEVDMHAAGHEESMPPPPPGSRPGPPRNTNRRNVGDSSQSALPRPNSASAEPPIELDDRVDAALSYNFGKECYMLSVKPDIKIRSEVQEAAALLDSASAEVTADSEASNTVEARISCAEYAQSLLDDSAAIES
eukprot:jgi/Tetstr1/430150/TSEL_019983.t1